MKKYICFDPTPTEPVAQPRTDLPAEPVAPVVEKKVYSLENQPKSKEEWQILSKEDPQKWIELTQTNYDRTFREKKELEEKLDRERQEKENLLAEVNRYKPAPTEPQAYGLNNFPKTQQEWDTLALENPTLAMDLRIAHNNRQQSVATDINRARADYAKEVQVEHPEMYLTELDAAGAPLKDDKGNIVFKKDATGNVIFNPNSEKGKLWEQIYKESYRPDGTNPLDNAPNAPRLMRAELERRLVSKGQAVVQASRQNQVAAPGVPPPVSFKVSFKSKEEEAHVETAVQRGIYKNKEEYCQLRDGGSTGYYQEGRRPDFTKK